MEGHALLLGRIPARGDAGSVAFSGGPVVRSNVVANRQGGHDFSGTTSGVSRNRETYFR